MGVKFYIASGNVSENQYCRAVCKLIDNTLTDDDFFLAGAGSTQLFPTAQTLAHYRDNYTGQQVIVIRPNIVADSILDELFGYYPDIPVVTSYFNGVASSPLPQPLAFSPNRQNTSVTVNGGVAGVSDFNTGLGLEFVDEAQIQYLSGGSNVLTLPITGVTNLGGGVARINFTSFAFAATNYIIHLSGISGFANNINGKRNIASVNAGSNFITINFELGAGTFSGPASAQIQWPSGAVAAVAAKLHKIMRGRNCSFWEARYCARETATEGGTHGVSTGYGEIDVDAAIAFGGPIVPDEFDTLGAVGTLSLNVNNGVAQFTHPEILHAKAMRLFANGKMIKESTGLTPGDTFTYSHYPIQLGNINYVLKGYRGIQATADSNTVNTNITELTGMPAKALYEKDDGTPYEITVYYQDGAQIKSSAIVEIQKTVLNPNSDNAGIQINKYLLTNGDLIDEAKLRASRRDLLFYLNGGNYINYFDFTAGSGVNIFDSPPPGDLCGQDFTNIDFTVDGDYDFTGAIIRNASLNDAILPSVYTDPGGLELFLETVAFCDIGSVIWITGNLIKDEL